VNPAAIILAAGESRRMGRSKAFLPFRGGTFLSAIAGTLGARCAPVIAVFGFDAERSMLQAASLAQAGSTPIAAVENRDYALGMLTSLQAGLGAIPEEADAALFTLVDHPAIALSTVDALLRSSAAIAIPRHQGLRGHPVLVRRGICEEFLREPASSKVRDVIDRHAAEIEYIEVADPGIADDIDDPALYEKLLAREASKA
jgi:molybdenum cofactor cytidylyltransferase